MYAPQSNPICRIFDVARLGSNRIADVPLDVFRTAFETGDPISKYEYVEAHPGTGDPGFRTGNERYFTRR